MSIFYPEWIINPEANFISRFLLKDHFRRYEFASKRLKGLYVLDIGCGSGYGCKILAKSAKQVVGVDISNTAINTAISSYGKDNIDFYQSDACTLIFPNDFFDCVVSFEMIEHLTRRDAQKFLEEAKRVLKPNGKVIISTPEKRNVSLSGKSVNPYHKCEYSLQDFKNLVGDFFIIEKVYGQDFTNINLINLFKLFAAGIIRKPVQFIWRIFQKLHFHQGDVVDYKNGEKIPWVNIICAYKI